MTSQTSQTKPELSYLTGYPDHLTDQIHQLISQDRLGEILLQKYPNGHDVRTDRALYEYVVSLKNQYMRKAGQISKVKFDSKLHLTHKALGIHTSGSARHGSKLKNRREIHIAALFKQAPADFLRMIVVHELAHTKELDHNKAFYQLCLNMEPDYYQLEFDLRAYLTYLQAGGEVLWQ